MGQIACDIHVNDILKHKEKKNKVINSSSFGFIVVFGRKLWLN